MINGFVFLMRMRRKSQKSKGDYMLTTTSMSTVKGFMQSHTQRSESEER